MAKSLHVKAKTPWKRINIPRSTFEDKLFDGLVDVQELTDYEFIESSKAKKSSKKRKASEIPNVIEEKKQKILTEDNGVDDKIKKGKRRKKKNQSDFEDSIISQEDNAEHEDGSNSGPSETDGRIKKGKSRKKKKKPAVDRSISQNDLVDHESKSKEDASLILEHADSSKIKKKQRAKKKSSKVLLEKKGQSGRKKENTSGGKVVNSLITTIKLGELSENVSKEKGSGIEGNKIMKKKRKNNPRRKKKAAEDSTPSGGGVEASSNVAAPAREDRNSDIDMSEWSNLFVPDVVLKSLQEQGFQSPTTIQTLSLPSAIRDHQDILAAAETGSGKTLAFGIPVVAKILSHQEKSKREKFGAEQILRDKGPKENSYNSDGEDDEEAEESGDEVTDGWEETQQTAESHSPPHTLILEPTRELAVQVHKHLAKMAKYTNIKFANVVGGMSVEKQRRLLKYKPEVIIATPGRLWQLIQEGDEHLSLVDQIHCLVVDEADRMVEKGHYEELTKLLQMINESPHKDQKRQSFVMSATLTMDVSIPKRVLNKVKEKNLEKDKLKMLTNKICVGTKPKIIDLTPKAKVAQSLTEMRVNCNAEEKDLYLYYFLCQHPGRTLVFSNSKDCLRRLVSVFTLLECSPFPLHADMQQRQRLKNLDRFSENDRGLLLASDVAARGLDIPNVDYVIHYQVPQTMENYVHRSGRTARASNVGLSVMLVGPEDARNYRKIVQGVKNGEELPIMPLDMDLIPAVKKRVELAREIDVAEYRAKKVRLHNNFFSKAAEEMDMIIDDAMLIPENDSVEKAQVKQQLKAMRHQLSAMLKGSLAPLHMTKYPTKSGKLMQMKALNLYDKNV